MKTAVKQSLLIFVVARFILVVWSIIVTFFVSEPIVPDSIYSVNQESFTEGINGLLLEPWQRWDANRYMRIAEVGYAEEMNSVFPPIYPMSARGIGYLLGGGPAGNMWAAILISNLSFIGLLILLFIATEYEFGQSSATRSLIYLSFFPTGFFLLAPYTESLFIFLALASIWVARHNGRFVLAGILGFFASLTRLTGWILVIPLAYEWWVQWGNPYLKQRQNKALDKEGHSTKLLYVLTNFIAVGLPGLGTSIFLVYRWAIGLPSLGTIYQEYWGQSPGIPGTDIKRALQTMFFGGNARQGDLLLWFDFFCIILLILTIYFTFRRLNVTYSLYVMMLLFFIITPVSEGKPLYSITRYTLASFPTFMMMAQAGGNPKINRAIIYPSFFFYLLFSSKFFTWGWIG